MGNIFFTVLTQPLANLLILLGNFSGGEMGSGIILLTLLIRILLLPLTARIVRDQEKIKELEPELAGMRKQFGNDRVKLGREMSRLFAERRVSPFRPLLLTLLQLPILIALWRLFSFSFNQNFLREIAYSFIRLKADASFDLFGLLPLQEKSIVVAVIAGITQWLNQSALSPRDKKALTLLFPFFSIFIFSSLPSALALYWASSSFFGMLESRLIAWKHLRQKKLSSRS